MLTVVVVVVIYQQKKINQLADLSGLNQLYLDEENAFQGEEQGLENEIREQLPRSLSELKETKIISGSVKGVDKGKIRVEALIMDTERVKSDADLAAAPLIQKELEIILAKETFLVADKKPEQWIEGDSVVVVCKESVYESEKLTADTIFSPAEKYFQR